MLKRMIPAIFILAVSFNCYSQTGKPDFKEIEKAIADKNSPFFYTPLMKRYTNNDTSLTLTELRYLYYGFSFQDSYSPYGSSAVKDELKKSITAGETDKIIELEKKVLTEFPFNLRNLNALVNVLDKKGDTAASNMYYKKLINLCKAILSTGDGASDSTAIYVISVEHEYDLIGLLGFEFGGSQALVYGKSGPMDKMKLKKNDDNIDYLYFNVDRLFASMEKMFKKKK